MSALSDANNALYVFINGGSLPAGGLQGLIDTLSHQVTGSTSTLLYSGKLNGISTYLLVPQIASLSEGKIAIIDNTEAMAFIKSDLFAMAVAKSLGPEITVESAAVRHAIWDDPAGYGGNVSHRFVAEAVGPFKTLSSGALWADDQGRYLDFDTAGDWLFVETTVFGFGGSSLPDDPFALRQVRSIDACST